MSSFVQQQIDGAVEALKVLGYPLFLILLVLFIFFFVLGKNNEDKADTYAEKVRTGKPVDDSEKDWMFMRRLTIFAMVIFISVVIIKGFIDIAAENERTSYSGNSHISSGPTYSSSSENAGSTYNGGYSGKSSNPYSSYRSAEEYAEDNVEEYLDSGDYDDYDEAYEAAMDDYEYDH